MKRRDSGNGKETKLSTDCENLFEPYSSFNEDSTEDELMVTESFIENTAENCELENKIDSRLCSSYDNNKLPENEFFIQEEIPKDLGNNTNKAYLAINLSNLELFSAQRVVYGILQYYLFRL